MQNAHQRPSHVGPANRENLQENETKERKTNNKTRSIN